MSPQKKKPKQPKQARRKRSSRTRASKKSRKLTTIAIPVSMCAKIDEVVETGEDGFVSRSDFVRHAIRLTLREIEASLEGNAAEDEETAPVDAENPVGDD